MDLIRLDRLLTFPAFRAGVQANLEQIITALSGNSTSEYVAEPYLGCVSNLGRAADSNSTSYTTSMSVTTRMAQSTITHPRILHHNYFSNTADTSERLPGSSCTYTDWIEYPIGVAYYGGAQVTAANGGYAVNDLGTIGVTIPAGALFKVWTKREGAQVFTGGRGSWHLGAGFLANPAGADLLPQLGHVFYPGAAWVNTYWPTVLDMTQRRSILIIDNSHGMGEGERGEPDMRGFYGFWERYLTDEIAWTNMSTRGMSLQHFIASHNNRADIGQYFTDIAMGLCGNDVNAGRNTGQILGDIDTVLGLYPDKDYLSGTETPKTSSTDGWTTTSGQSQASSETTSREVSRAKMYGQRFKRVYDWCRGTSFMRTDGIIVHQPNLTADGNHFNATGYQLAAEGARAHGPLL